MSFVDRLSGRFVPCPPTLAHFGRWVFDPSDGAGHINGRPVSDNDVLAPGGAGGWAFVRVGEAIPARGRFFADALPDDQDMDALREFGRVLLPPGKVGDGWLEWIETSPLAPGLDETVRPHPLERQIEAEIGHLTAVCQNPRTHIRHQAERVLIARARRIARDAPARLASHTEDWEHRTITGIQPRRVLADMRDERWDLYENRVAVRLVDDLIVWLRKRIDEVRRIRDDVYARMKKIDGSASGTRHRAHRIFTLWGDGWDDSVRGVANATLDRLENLLYRLLALTDSRLYRHIPARAYGSSGLRTTNLFANDDHYRGVVRLWHEWSRQAVPNAPSPSELWTQYQELHHGFDAWCMLLVVRACSQLGLEPVDDDLEAPIRPGRRVRVNPRLCIEWDSRGTVTLSDPGEAGRLLRFVPLIHGLERARTEQATEARIAPLAEAVLDEAHWTVVLHLAMPSAPSHEALSGVANPPWPSTRGAVDFIRVSPFSLDSVERVSRAIRWATLVPRLLSYPPVVHAIPESALRDAQDTQALLTPTRPHWLADSGGTPDWTAVQPPHDSSLLDAAARDLARTLEKKAGCVQERGQLRGDRANDSTRRNLRRQIQRLEDVVAELDGFAQTLREAHSVFDDLTTCPACGKADAAFEARENDCFAARCLSKGCEARWELRQGRSADGAPSRRLQGAAESRIPAFLPGGSKPDEWPDDAFAQWVDEILGCDVLAIPAKGADGNDHFLDPRDTPRSRELDAILPPGRA